MMIVKQKFLFIDQDAHDVTTTLCDIPSVERLLAVLNAFERCSGLKMNLTKTKAIWIGANKVSSAKP